MSSENCPNWPPISAMCTSTRPTGIWKRSRVAAVGHGPNHRWGKGGTLVKLVRISFPFAVLLYRPGFFGNGGPVPTPSRTYRDSFRLLLRFANQRLGKAPSTLTLDDLTVPFIGDFLDSLETGRKNGARSRNIRLAAIHSFFQLRRFPGTHPRLAVPAHPGDTHQTPPTPAYRISPSRRDRCVAGGYR